MDEQKKENSSMLESILSTPTTPEIEDIEEKIPIFAETTNSWNNQEPPQNQIKKPKKKKTPQEILRILWALFLAWAVLFWAFISYIVFNPENARFFISLGINPQDIKNYIQVLVNGSFGLITIIISAISLIFLFRAFVTKKEFAKKKTIATILAAFSLIVLFSEITLWIFLTQKIWATDYINPNWWVIIRDVDKSKMPDFKNWADIISSFDNMVWPINTQFDLSSDSRFVSKYIDITWYKIDFDWDGTFDKIGTNPETAQDIIFTYDKKWSYIPKWIYSWKDKVTWESIEKEMWLPAFNIAWVVKVEEAQNRLWWIRYTFDFTEIFNLWNIKLFFLDEKWKQTEDKNYNWKDKVISRIYKKPWILCLILMNNQTSDMNCNKLFFVWWDLTWSNQGIQITSDRDNIDPLSFRFWIDFWKTEKVISVYNWSIDWDQECGNEEVCEFKFIKYWKHKLHLQMKEPGWAIIELDKDLDIKKPLVLSLPNWEDSSISTNNSLLRVTDKDGNSAIANKYLRDLQEYHANVNIPSELTFNSNYVKVTDSYYDLEKTEWDFDNNWKFEKSWNEVKYSFLEDKKYTVTVKYTFNSKIKNDIQTVSERIVFEAEKKNIYLKLDVKQDSDYAPTVLHFDWSATYAKDGIITKFTYDFWEWRPATDWDAKQDYKYNFPWEYIVTFTATKEDWTKDSVKKKIILKEAWKEVVVNASVSSWFVWKTIDFDAVWTKGQIDSYLWDFWDGTKLSEATPSHSYSEAWEYTVKLTITFTDWIIKYWTKKITIN